MVIAKTKGGEYNLMRTMRMIMMTTKRTTKMTSLKTKWFIENFQHAGKTTFVNVIASGQFNEDMVILINLSSFSWLPKLS